jgi:hypothetical protein
MDNQRRIGRGTVVAALSAIAVAFSSLGHAAVADLTELPIEPFQWSTPRK